MNITLPRAVIEQTLKALQGRTSVGYEAWQACEDAITALRTALEQPEQEPVGWIDYIVKEAHEKYDLATSRAAFQAGAIFVQRLLNTSPEFMDCVITKRSNHGNQ